MVRSEADPAKRAGIRNRLWVIGRKISEVGYLKSDFGNQQSAISNQQSAIGGRKVKSEKWKVESGNGKARDEGRIYQQSTINNQQS
jgi:hypothetical protein